MLIVLGTIPIEGMPLTLGYCQFKNEILKAGQLELPLTNGTSVMIAAAATTCNALGIENPYAVLAGDIGTGDGSNQIYRFLRDSINLPQTPSKKVVFAMHYIKPNIMYARQAVNALRKLDPILIADAGSMYVAKAAGIARDFDLFTPDPGEMAFLADPEALHPAYVRNYIFDSLNDIPWLIKKAYENSNASKVLLVKGSTDYVANKGEIVAKVEKPNIAALEPIGGTGDTLTGIASALIFSGLDSTVASIKAAKTNRLMGFLCDPKPSTKVWEMIPRIPQALETLKTRQELNNLI